MLLINNNFIVALCVLGILKIVHRATKIIFLLLNLPHDLGMRVRLTQQRCRIQQLPLSLQYFLLILLGAADKRRIIMTHFVSCLASAADLRHVSAWLSKILVIVHRLVVQVSTVLGLHHCGGLCARLHLELFKKHFFCFY